MLCGVSSDPQLQSMSSSFQFNTGCNCWLRWFYCCILQNCWLVCVRMLSRFSHVQFCDPVGHSPPVSCMGFSRGSSWPGSNPRLLHFLHWQVGSLPLELPRKPIVKTKVKVKLFSSVWLLATLWTVAYQAPLSMGFFREGYWSELPFPSPGDLPKWPIKCIFQHNTWFTRESNRRVSFVKFTKHFLIELFSDIRKYLLNWLIQLNRSPLHFPQDFV